MQLRKAMTGLSVVTAALVAGYVHAGEQSAAAPVKAAEVTVADSPAKALAQQNADLKAEVEKLKAELKTRDAQEEALNKELAAQKQQNQQLTAVLAAGATKPPAVAPATKYQATITKTRATYGRQGVVASAEVTLKNAEDIPFTLRATLTQVDGKPFSPGVSMERIIKTGDDEDSDEYSLTLPTKSIPAGTEVEVHFEVLDREGRSMDKAPIQRLRLFR